ncbi:hypothetical protein F5888DRAFT_1638164 [Russula emetica]|nr:hypothetical protein F5888DRAFT_1638164 [Russula emetica]
MLGNLATHSQYTMGGALHPERERGRQRTNNTLSLGLYLVFRPRFLSNGESSYRVFLGTAVPARIWTTEGSARGLQATREGENYEHKVYVGIHTSYLQKENAKITQSNPRQATLQNLCVLGSNLKPVPETRRQSTHTMRFGWTYGSCLQFRGIDYCEWATIDESHRDCTDGFEVSPGGNNDELGRDINSARISAQLTKTITSRRVTGKWRVPNRAESQILRKLAPFLRPCYAHSSWHWRFGDLRLTPASYLPT